MSKIAKQRALEAYPNVEQPVWDESYPKTLFVRHTERNAFIKGYEQAEKDLGWISVKEKLPPEDEEVIVLTNEANGHTLPIACHLCFAHIVSDKTMFVDYDGWNIPQVKYWMPCPELPEK